MNTIKCPTNLLPNFKFSQLFSLDLTGGLAGDSSIARPHQEPWGYEREMVEIGRAIGAKEVNPFPDCVNYDVTRYQSTQVQGGAIMAKSPDSCLVNMHQQHRDISNLSVIGASTIPNNGAANPTPTILALTYRTAEAMVDKYLKRPGMLA